MEIDPLISSELAKHDDGVPFRAKSGHVHSTWAKTFLSLPELYFQPETLPEIEKIIQLAGKCRRRVTTTGCGHSPNSMTCTSSWLVNLDKFNQILSVDKDACVVVMQSGIRLYQLGDELDKHGLAMPNLGSINQQSLAGAISTGTHGSSMYHGLMSENVLALRLTTADGSTRYCSPDEDPELFRAALLSLGALGIITEITFRAVPAFTLRWRQVIDADSKVFELWDKGLWTDTEFVRVWWYPYTRRAVRWTASQTDEAAFDPPPSYYDGALGYLVYHNLLYLCTWAPRLTPWVEWFVYGMQFGFRNGTATEAVQPSRRALLMNCLYSQYVNEWALPLHKGPEALRRLSSWLNRLPATDPDYVPHGIPFPADGIWVHAPVEVRVSNTTPSNPRCRASSSDNDDNDDDDGNDPRRPLLDPTPRDAPALYLNATLYRPYHRDPACRARYYEAFEWLMRDLGGRPHWAKNFETDAAGGLERMYGDDLRAWRRVRDALDPEGMFVGPWHRRFVLGGGGEDGEDAAAALPLEERDLTPKRDFRRGVHFEGVVGTTAR